MILRSGSHVVLGFTIRIAKRIAALLFIPSTWWPRRLPFPLRVKQLDVPWIGGVTIPTTIQCQTHECLIPDVDLPQLTGPVESGAPFPALGLVRLRDVVVQHIAGLRVVTVIRILFPRVFVRRICVRAVRNSTRLLRDTLLSH